MEGESTSNPNVLGMDSHQAFMARSVPAAGASATLDCGEPQGLDWPAYQAAQHPQREARPDGGRAGQLQYYEPQSEHIACARVYAWFYKYVDLRGVPEESYSPSTTTSHRERPPAAATATHRLVGQLGSQAASARYREL